MFEDKGHSGHSGPAYNEPNFGGPIAKPTALTPVNNKTKRYFSFMCNGTKNLKCLSSRMITSMNYQNYQISYINTDATGSTDATGHTGATGSTYTS